MKITIAGLWHLGLVTSACLAELGHDVIAYDDNRDLIINLKNGIYPIFEPGLDELLKTNFIKQKLKFVSDPEEISNSDIVWITYDTPVDNRDCADVDFVMSQVSNLFPVLKNNCLLLISSQLPVGSTHILESRYHEFFPSQSVGFAYSPENLRLGKAIESFLHPDRIVVGIQHEDDKNCILKLLEGISTDIVFMSIRSAEMTKHALNSFLANSIVFMNDFANLCEQVGADAHEVERGLKSDGRIGSKAYLRPGGAFSGGTLARDLTYLIDLSKKCEYPTQLFSTILESNYRHKKWAVHRISQVLGDLRGKKIAMLGLAYKSGTNTLRCSNAIEMCYQLSSQGAIICAYDQLISLIPDRLADFISLKHSFQSALSGVDAVILTTNLSELKSITADDFINEMKNPLIFDENSYLKESIKNDHRIRYFTVGVAA